MGSILVRTTHAMRARALCLFYVRRFATFQKRCNKLRLSVYNKKKKKKNVR